MKGGPIPLFTSIPPRISRLDANGAEIGQAYQLYCIESWRRAGFEPVSVNSAKEAHPHGLRVISVASDASAITGRPHVFLANLLAVAATEAQGSPFALINADLILTAPDISDRVAQLRPGEFIFSRRLDIGRLGQTVGTPYPHGYDFFAVHPNDIVDIPDIGMVFGAPWWDHFFPLLMFMRGCRIYQAEPLSLHLNHIDRYDSSLWTSLGPRFMAEIRPHITDAGYRKRLDDAVVCRSGRLLSDLKYKLRKILHWNPMGETQRMLILAADANVSFLDKMSSRRFT